MYVHQRLANYGKWTYRGAWLLEIVAATIGLATGLLLGMQAYKSSETATSIDLIMASAPFFMVALAELTRIPIATLLFSASWLWKPLLALFLCALALITFGTVFSGLEKQAGLRQLRYDEIEEKITAKQAEAQQLEKARTELLGNSRTEKAQAEYDKLEKQWTDARNVILADLDRLAKELAIPPTLAPKFAEVDRKISERSTELQQIKAERNSELERANNSFQSQQKSYLDRIDSARKAGDQLAVAKWESELAALRNPQRLVDQKYSSRIADLENQISALRQEKDELSGQIAAGPDSAASEFEARRKSLTQDLQKTDAEWKGRLDVAREEVAKAQSDESTAAAKVSEIQTQLTNIEGELSTLRRQRIPIARDDQIRHIAGTIFGAKPEDVTNEQAHWVALAWFGSLAVLAALAGPLTAMVALGLQMIAERGETHRDSKLSRLIRRWLLRWRFRRTKQLTVRLEVPVEKVVEKRVEVPIPVEKVVKELLYIPILTDDPEAVKRALSAELPPEIANLVKVRAGAALGGSSA